MPESSCGILSDIYHEAVGCILRCNALYGAVEAAETITQDKSTDTSKALVKILFDLACNKLQLVREWWAQAVQARWNFKDKELRFLTFMLAGAPSNTRTGNEQVFQRTKHEAVVSNSNSRVSWPRLYRILGTAHSCMGTTIPALEVRRKKITKIKKHKTGGDNKKAKEKQKTTSWR